jgi:uncharacterized membrane protein
LAHGRTGQGIGLYDAPTGRTGYCIDQISRPGNEASADVYNIASEENDWEKAVITILIVAAVTGGIYWLCNLQGHLRRTRLVIDPCDKENRGLEIVYGMVGAMILSAIVVCYLLLRDGSYEMLLMICLAFAMLPMGV